MGTRKSGRSKGRATTAAKRPPTVKEAIDQPTPEQAARATFDLGTVKTEMGQFVGRAYRRRPLFETMRANGGLSPDEVDALRFYRASFDRIERSPMKSCLNVEPGGGLTPASAVFTATPSVLVAKRNVRLCEAGLGFNLPTMRAVALLDRTFSEIAIERYGGRDQDWIVDGEPRTRIAPRSGRHRQIIREEFGAALKVLTDTVRSLTTRAAVQEVWVYVDDDGTATIRRGLQAPNGLYRCWGDSEKLDTIMEALRVRWGRQLKFRTPELARAALDEADAGRLSRLEPDELAP